jgi:hypothetical protein
MPLKHHTQTITSKPNHHNPHHTHASSSTAASTSTSHVTDNHFYTVGEFRTPLHIRPTHSNNNNNSTTRHHGYGIDSTTQHYDQWLSVETKEARIGVGAVFGNERQLSPITVHDIHPSMMKAQNEKENHTNVSTDTSTVTQPSVASAISSQALHHPHPHPKAYAFTIPSTSEQYQNRNDAIRAMQQEDKELKQVKLQSRYQRNQTLQSNVLDSKLQDDMKAQHRDIMNLRSKVKQRDIYHDSLSKREGQF